MHFETAFNSLLIFAKLSCVPGNVEYMRLLVLEKKSWNQDPVGCHILVTGVHDILKKETPSEINRW